jgi:diguanylate cyclase (GGDEF)-like protein
VPLLANAWRLSPLIVVVLSFFLVRISSIEALDENVLRTAPYLLACILLGFSAMFNRSRFIAPIFIALFAYYFIQTKLQTPLTRSDVMAMFSGLNLLFCTSLMFASLVPEKGMFNRTGGVYALVLAAGAMLLWYFGASEAWQAKLAAIANHQSALFEDRYWVTEALLYCHALCFSVLALLALIRKHVADFALLLTWLSGVAVFFDFSSNHLSSVCFSMLFLALFILYQQSNYQVTYKDALTGISGRRALEDYLSTLGRHYSVAMLDVDHFKKFNDTHGHDVGDQVLRMVASKIAQVEGGGRAFRYGGEEFTIVFNRRSADDIFVFAEAVRESIQNYALKLRSDDREQDKKTGKKHRGQGNPSKTVSVTISIGLANSEPGYRPAEVIKKADDLLYKAKEAGRNCTIKESPRSV